LCNGLGQATYTCVPLSPSSVTWYRSRGLISLARKVMVGLVESNGSLPLGLWLMSPAGWLPRDQDQLCAQRSYRVGDFLLMVHIINGLSVSLTISEQ